MIFRKLQRPSTFLKYLLSYILIFTVLMAAFFLILRNQLTNVYSSQQTERIQNQMVTISAQLNDEFYFLKQIDSLITGNADIVNSNYKDNVRYSTLIFNELEKLDIASKLVSGMVFHSHFNNQTVPVRRMVSYQDGVFGITNVTTMQTIYFDSAPWLNGSAGQLIWLDDGSQQHLLYFPPNSSLAKYIYFYFLDTSVLQNQIRGLASDEVPGVAILDGSGNFITQIGMAAFADDPALTQPEPGIRTLQDGSSLFLSGPLHSDFYLAAVVSADYLPQQVNRAFLGSSAGLLALSVLGIVLVHVAMGFTYRPLQRLVQSLGHEPQENRRYLEFLSKNYSELNSQKRQLEQTLAEYRESLALYRAKEITSRDYPHEELDTLSHLLEENHFAEAGALLEGLLIRFGQGAEQDYFLGCILLDCLTLINNSMSKAHIDFDSYSQVFSEAVLQCRNIPETKNFDTLSGLIHELLFFYEKQTTNRLVHITPLRQIVEENFCDPTFSVSVIANAYHVSDSRMSTLFKEEMGIGFTDFVWQLRLKKAQALLRTTELPVDEISLQIGYLTPNSFRRKFKQETGLTPSQYREMQAEEN